MNQTITIPISNGACVRRIPEIGIVDIEVDLGGLQECAALSEPLRAAAIQGVEGLMSQSFNMSYIERRVSAGIAPFTLSRPDEDPHAVGVCIAATPAGLRYAHDRWDGVIALLKRTAADLNGG